MTTAKKKTIVSALVDIQARLHAPKSQRNTFGNYNYRSCEDIIEAVKPLCHEHGLSLTISDEMIHMGDRFYIKATATITGDAGEHAATAIAREAFSQKGMNDAQLTGSTSSYARKYALNGLFAIDDTKDDDTRPPLDPNEKLDAHMKRSIQRLMADLTDNEQAAFLEWANVEAVSEIKVIHYEAVTKALKAKLKTKGK